MYNKKYILKPYAFISAELVALLLEYFSACASLSALVSFTGISFHDWMAPEPNTINNKAGAI